MTDKNPKESKNEEQEDVKKIMDSQRIDADQAEKVRDIMEEYNVSEDEAVNLKKML